MRRRELFGLLASLACWSCSRRDEGEGPPETRTKREAPPSPAPARVGPLGSLDDVPEPLRPAFADAPGHTLPPVALARGDEPAQDFPRFLAEQPPELSPARSTLALLPIGEYPRGFIVEYDSVRLVRSPAPELLAEVVAAWFGLPVRVLPAIPDDELEGLPIREQDGRRQLDAAAMIEWLGPRKPKDCACLLALTLEDLYAAPEPESAFVFGYASTQARVGVHSMLRYDPGFADVTRRPPDFQQRILERGIRVICHELAHLFGLRHCIHYACVMNPTAGVRDLDELPWRLCPVCLRKLWTVADFDIAERWRELTAIAAAHELDAEQAWFTARLAALASG